mgnify:CR=1 FL=1
MQECCGVVLVYNFLLESKISSPVRWAFHLREPCDMSMQDIVTMLCPRPVCVCHGAQDPIYPVDSVQQVIDRAEQVYRDAGCTDHFQSAIFPNAGHVFEEEQQKYAIDFLNKWL